MNTTDRKGTGNPTSGKSDSPGRPSWSPILDGLRNLERLRYRAVLASEPATARWNPAARRFLERRLLGLSVALREELGNHPGWGAEGPSRGGPTPLPTSPLPPRRLGAFARREIEEIREHLQRAETEDFNERLKKLCERLLREERLLEDVFRLTA